MSARGIAVRATALALVAFTAAGCVTGAAAPPTLPGTLAQAASAPIGAVQPERDEHWAALQRQLEEPVHRRPDKDDQLLVPMADAGHWKRVRFWLIDHFVGFRYGEDFDALNVVFIHDIEPGTPLTSDTCMKVAERWARPQLRAFDVRLGPVRSRKATWKHGKERGEIAVRTADALVDYGTGPAQFSAAWAAYPAYEDACLVFAFAVPWGEHRELAGQVRDRWIEQAVPKLKPLTDKRPHRIED